jgi:hypothetical protein
MNERSDGDMEANDHNIKKAGDKKRSSKVKIGRRCFVSEHATPQVRWVEGATCPICGSGQLMDAKGMALCVSCNKFVRPKKKGDLFE